MVLVGDGIQRGCFVTETGAAVQDFRKLDVWHLSHRLAVDLQLAFDRLPGNRSPGLRTQLLKAASSVPANLAEGCGHPVGLELARYAEMANASAKELENHLQMAHDVGIMSASQHEEFSGRVNQVQRMLVGLAKTIRANKTSARKKRTKGGGPDAPAE